MIYLKKKKALAILAVLLIGSSICITGCNNSKEDISEGELVSQNENSVSIAFPYDVEGTNITVESLSQASVPNPDSDGTFVDNIACIEVKNNSDTYISAAEMIFEMQDGTEFIFKITDIPSGSLVQAFDVNNSVYDEEIACKKVSVEKLTTQEGSQRMEDVIAIDVEETIVTLTNISDDTLHHISIVCHCDIDGSYFGGCSYTYDIDSIPVGESIDVDASDCYLGQASVVRVYRNHE